MPRGGARQGAPGKAYSNRQDMNQPVRVASGQQYGQRQALEQAQKAVPLPQQNTPAPPGNQPSPDMGMAQLPGANPFTRPTERPSEPVTAGLPIGPGPGPEALTTVAPAQDQVGDVLRMLYAQNPNNDLLRLVELHDHGY